MSELDLFEPRFVEAYRRHLDKAPRPLDAASVVRAVTAQPRGRSIPWPWASRPLVLRPARAFSWIVLLGLLIAALAVGIFIGSQHVRPLPAVIPTAIPTAVPVSACPPGSSPNEPGPADQARPNTPPIAMAFDRRAGRLVALVGVADDVETWTFDVCTNTWMQMHPVHEPNILRGWDAAYDTDSALTILVDRDQPMNVWAYDLRANTWTRHGFAPLDVTPVAYDPITGLVIAASSFDATQLWDYDVETDTWTPIRQADGPANVQVFAYDASVDRLIAYAAPIGREATWLLDIRTGSWSMSHAETPGVVWGMYRPAVAYDEAAERTVVGFQVYDASADRWESLTDDFEPMFRRGGPMVYDAVNQRLVGYREGDSQVTAGLIALDVLTREWTVLLEAQPTTTERGVS